MDVFTSYRHHNAHAVHNVENMEFHKNRPVPACVLVAAPFLCVSGTFQTKKQRPKKSETGNKKLRVSASLQTTGLALQFDTQCCGREPAPHSKKKRGNVEEPPHQKTTESVEGNPKKIIFGARKDGRTPVQWMSSPDCGWNKSCLLRRQRRTSANETPGKKDGTALSTSSGASPIAGGSRSFSR